MRHLLLHRLPPVTGTAVQEGCACAGAHPAALPERSKFTVSALSPICKYLMILPPFFPLPSPFSCSYSLSTSGSNVSMVHVLTDAPFAICLRLHRCKAQQWSRKAIWLVGEVHLDSEALHELEGHGHIWLGHQLISNLYVNAFTAGGQGGSHQESCQVLTADLPTELNLISRPAE